MKPPRAQKKPREVITHGDMLVDEYHWLRDREDPETIRYIRAENDYADEMAKGLEYLQGEIYAELVARTPEDDTDTPVRIDDFEYYHRTEKGKQYPLYCRRRLSGGAPEEVIIDQNALSEGRDFFHIDSVKPSPDHAKVAFSVDMDGSEHFDVKVVDLGSHEIIDDQVTGTGGFEWGLDGRTIYYIVYDHMQRPSRVMRHFVGTKTGEDSVVYEEPDLGCEYMSLSKSKSREYLFVTVQTLTTGEVNFLRAGDDAGVFRPVLPRRKGVRYYVLHGGGDFTIVTNDGAPNFKIVRAPVAAPSQENWQEILPHSDSRIVNVSDPFPWVDVFSDHLVVFERENAISSIRVIDLATGKSHIVELPETLRGVWPLENPDLDSTSFRFAYTSMMTPRRTYEYDMAGRELKLVKEEEVRGYDPSDYHAERVHVPVSDGTIIPMNIMHRKGLKKDSRNPLLLYAYGAAGDFETSSPSLDPMILSLLERGFVYAVAGIRGGGEYGQHWYDSGRMLNKKNCFSDFIDSAEYLIREGYTSKELLAARGGSAGGLLVAAATTMRPDLFRVVLAEVPFVDVIHTMLDESIPLVIGEYEEYGDLHEPEVYEYCKSYSPYENVRPVRYPKLFVTSGMNDPRVPFWEPIKWVARIRDIGAEENTIMLRTKMSEGHHGSHARYDSMKEEALKLAFIAEDVRCGAHS
ncbi:MAG: S9 family peptidase [Methanobacteriota archaeon]|nr:MAG: S9 family peptidase [Euryarchaeota archaeon]